MKIRIATQAIPKPGISREDIETLDDVRFGAKIPWVELDGHRFEDLTGAQVNIRAGYDDATIASLTLDLVGPVEVVYLVGDRVVGSAPTPVDRLPAEMGPQTAVMPAPDGPVVDRFEPPILDSEKLRLLADWHDARDDLAGVSARGREVQTDLRRIAAQLEEIHG